MNGAEVRIEMREEETRLSPEALARAFDLMATWALRRARVSPGGLRECGERRVTGYVVMGYGA